MTAPRAGAYAPCVAPTAGQARAAAAWRHVRAVLVTGHVAAIVLTAVPGPDGGMNRGMWQDPSVQSELVAWSARLGTTPARLDAWVFPIALQLFNVRNAIRAPVVPYVDWTGNEQPWRLFVAPDRVPSHFELAARRVGVDAPWVTLFEERSATARWHAWYFEHPRVRRALYWYGWPPVGAQSALHCRWVARWVFAEHPEFEEVRCRFYRAPSPSAAQVRAGVEPPGTWGQIAQVSRVLAAEPLQ